MTLIERHNTSQNPDFQRRVKIAALMIAGRVLTSPVPEPPPQDAPESTIAAYNMKAAQRQFAQRVAGDPDAFTPRISLSLAAMAPVTVDTPDDALLAAMSSLFEVYTG